MGRFSKLERPGPPPSDGPSPAAGQTPPAATGDASPLAGVRPPDAASGRGGMQDLPPGDRFEYPTIVQQADAAFFDGRYRDALRFFSKALQLETTSIVPWIGQVRSLVMIGQTKEAMLWCQKAVDQFPEDPAILSLQGICLAHSGMVKRAVGVSDYALSKKAADAITWVSRGEILLLAKNGNATFCFSKAMEADGGDWRIGVLAGLALERARQWASALEFYQKAQLRNDAHAFIWSRIGECSARLGFRDRAEAAFQRALSIAPQYKTAREGLAKMQDHGFLDWLKGRLRR